MRRDGKQTLPLGSSGKEPRDDIAPSLFRPPRRPTGSVMEGRLRLGPARAGSARTGSRPGRSGRTRREKTKRHRFSPRWAQSCDLYPVQAGFDREFASVFVGDLPVRVIRWIVATLLVVLAAILFIDGLLFGLRLPDPALGRDSGCFTLLDDILRTRTPFDQLRWVEILSPILALAVGYLLLTHHDGSARIRSNDS